MLVHIPFSGCGAGILHVLVCDAGEYAHQFSLLLGMLLVVLSLHCWVLSGCCRAVWNSNGVRCRASLNLATLSVAMTQRHIHQSCFGLFILQLLDSFYKKPKRSINKMHMYYQQTSIVLAAAASLLLPSSIT